MVGSDGWQWILTDSRIDHYTRERSNKVTTLDVLELIRRINAHPNDTSLPDPPDFPPPYYDVNGDGSVDISTGVGRFTGMATQDPFHRLHLLLTPVPSLLQRLAASVRLLVFGVAMLTIVSALSALVRRRAAADLVRSIRGSFHAKLLAALLLASVVPLIGLALFPTWGEIQRLVQRQRYLDPHEALEKQLAELE